MAGTKALCVVPPRPAGAFGPAWYVTGIWPLHGPLCEDDGVNVEDLRLAVYRMFAGTGRAPDTGQLAGQLQASLPEVTWGLKELASARHLVLGDQGQIVMAHRSEERRVGKECRSRW